MSMLVVTVDHSQQARRVASRFLVEVTPGVFAGSVSHRVREALLNQLECNAPQFTAVWMAQGRMEVRATGLREDGRRVVDLDGLPVASVPDNTTRGRVFRRRAELLAEEFPQD